MIPPRRDYKKANDSHNVLIKAASYALSLWNNFPSCLKQLAMTMILDSDAVFEFEN